MRFSLPQIAQWHIDAMGNPNHPLANHPITSAFSSIAQNEGIQPSELMKAFQPHFDAVGDPSHALASHPLTNAFRQFPTPDDAGAQAPPPLALQPGMIKQPGLTDTGASQPNAGLQSFAKALSGMGSNMKADLT